jgi:ectoine hydroxylase-related dioxygenase (phytanoyl-CoA dioxygenase family)
VLPSVNCKTGSHWLERTLELLRVYGCAIVEGVLDRSFLGEAKAAMYRVQTAIVNDIGTERLQRAGELGVLRLMLKYDSFFFRFFEIPEMLAIVDQTVSDTAIVHLQNGFILPPYPRGETPSVFQNRFHQDFPRVLNGYQASLNVMFAIDEFTAENGGTLVVPGTHQRIPAPSVDYLNANAVSVECAEGCMLVFDSTLWHAAGPNASGRDRLAVNHQFTRSFFKQQIDYVRALGNERLAKLPARVQQLLGWYTRVVTSLDEYYRPESERLYRKGQG